MSRDDDLLERATRALRATPPPNEGELAQAKLRMLAAHQAATKKGNARTLRWVLPLAAVLAAGSALAATPQGRELLASAVNRVVGYEILALESKPAALAKRAASKPAPRTPAPSEPAPLAAAPAPSEPAASAPSEPAPSEPAPAPAAATPHPPIGAESPAHVSVPRSGKPRSRKLEPELTPAPAAPEPATEPPAPVPTEEPALASVDLAKYKAAHKAHFQQRDFALALRNWEAYLRQFPSGTFAIEARYNRAICLLRLGRNDEARRALTPFANGEIGGGYRRAEATKLLEALE